MAYGNGSNHGALHNGQPMMLDTSPIHAEGWSGSMNDFALYSLTDTSSAIGVVDNPRYSSLDALTETQHVQPIRSVQSAPLAAPPRIPIAAMAPPCRVGEVSLPTGPAYSEQRHVNPGWLPGPVALPYQMQHPQTISYQTNLDPPLTTGRDQIDMTPRPAATERWPG